MQFEINTCLCLTYKNQRSTFLNHLFFGVKQPSLPIVSLAFVLFSDTRKQLPDLPCSAAGCNTHLTLQSRSFIEPFRARRQPSCVFFSWLCSLQGILDVEDSLAERSDKFFSDLQAFRSLNRDKCVYSPPTQWVPPTLSQLTPLGSSRVRRRLNKTSTRHVSHSENSSGDCYPSMLGNSCSPDADVDTHQCRESCNFTVILWLMFSSQLLSGCWLESVDLFVLQACSPIWWTTGSSSSRVTLRSVVPCAKCPKPVTLTLSVTQRSSGKNGVDAAWF